MKRLTWLATCVVFLVAGCRQHASVPPQVLRLAVTTSTRDSGLLDQLVPLFEQRQDARVDIIAVGTGAALKLGESGDVDVVLVHAREAEEAFLREGHGVRREDVMYNEFEILGPADDPASIRELAPTAALLKIADSGRVFVSRGDHSGTHQRELQLWNRTSGPPSWDGYVESGQGMGATLTMADQMHAYVLTDHGTYLKFRSKIHLVPLVTSTESLRNPYGVMVVNPEQHASVKASLAHAFVDFLVSDEVQRLIRDYRIEGERLFYSARLSEE